MLSQQQLQKQQLKISPQQIQLLNFYALNMLELENRIQTEIEENPFLDTKDTDTNQENEPITSEDQANDYDEWDNYDDNRSEKQEYSNYFGKEQIPQKPLANFVDFKQDAKQQLAILNIDEDKKEIAEYLIDTLNDQGFLERSLEDIAEGYSFQKKTWVEDSDIQNALDIVQQLEPVGIGTTCIQECLLAQLKQNEITTDLSAYAKKLIEHHYDELINRQFEKLCQTLNIDNSKLKEVLHFIGKLKFYPVSERSSSTEPRNTIMPDFIITNQGGQIQVNLYSSKSGSVFINSSLYDQMKDSGKQKSTKQYINSKIKSAQWFVDAVRQRETTMLSIMRAIVDFQEEYFADGDIQKLKPMVLKNIADITDYDLSTISRITANRYADTHFGTIYLKDLFGESLSSNKGKSVSNKVIQSMIQDIVDGEDSSKPYTDQQITNMLKERGIKIARRTVSKYRELLDIPIAQIRSMQFTTKN